MVTVQTSLTVALLAPSVQCGHEPLAQVVQFGCMPFVLFPAGRAICLGVV